jgi:hypothetical protein
MVLLTSTQQNEEETNVEFLFTVPASVKQTGTVSVTRVLLPDPPWVFAMSNQLISDNAEEFDTQDARSLEELAVQLTAIRQASGAQLCACYVTGAEFTICTFANDVAVAADLAYLLNIPTFLPKQMCYSAMVNIKHSDQSFGTRIVATGVRGLVTNGAHSTVLVEYGRGELLPKHVLRFEHISDTFGVTAVVLKKDGTVVPLVARDWEPYTMNIEIV